MEKADAMDARRKALQDAMDALRVPPAYNHGKWFVGSPNFAQEVRAGMNLPAQVDICDVSLRETDQTYTEKEYIALGRALDEIGVSVIQFLSPRGQGKGEGKESEPIKALRELGKLNLRAKLQIYGVNSEQEMDLAAQYGVDSISYTIFPIPAWQPIYASRRAFTEPSPLLEKAKAVQNEDELIEYLETMAEAVKMRGMKPRPQANFFSMAPLDFLRRLARSCERAGVYALGVIDAAGSMGPAGFRYVVSEMKKAAPGLAIGIHAHNDLGLATANALAGVEAGASKVDVTVNGIGARTGNTSLAEVAVALEALYRIDTGIKLEKLTALSTLFGEMARQPLPKNMPLVGEYAFTDSAETHSYLLQADPLLFTPVRPELVGNERRSHLGLKSGVNTLKMRLRELGMAVPEEQLPDLLAAVKAELLQKRRSLTAEEMRECLNRSGHGMGSNL